MEETVQIPVYKYWRPVFSTEHYLLLNEIAQLWNLYSTRGKRKARHSLLTTVVLHKYCEMNDIQPVYYETRYGLKEVYSREVYEGAYRWFLGQTNNGQDGSIKIDGKNYAFTMGLPDSNG